VATTAAPTFAAKSVPYSASFPNESTFFTSCPTGTPPGAVCFSGSDHSGAGRSIPPNNRPATEDFTGYIDTQHTCTGPGGTGNPDFNTVTISTQTGNIFLTTMGCATQVTDDGTWTITGGTGQFAGATGSGTVHTQTTGGAPPGPIFSSSTYSGTIVLL
jgi:hypothetical protein